jgi:hypothetical protein
MRCRDRPARGQPNEGKRQGISGGEMSMPWRIRLVDFAVSAACCKRITENRVTRAVEPRRRQEISIERDQSQ